MPADPNDYEAALEATARGVKLHGHKLYAALETIVRQNAGGFPIGHDAIVAARAALADASFRRGRRIDWAKETRAADLGWRGDTRPAPADCSHDRLTEDGVCRGCGADRRGIGG